MRLAVAALALSSLLCAAAPAAALEVERVLVVGRAAAGEPWRSGATEARLSDRAQLAAVAVVRAGRRGPRRYLTASAVRPLVIDGRPIPDRSIGAPGELTGAAIRWFLVEPHAWRRPGSRASNGATTDYHSNVSTAAGDFGRWLGYDALEYFETALGEAATKEAAWQRPASARPSAKAEDVHGGLGTVRYKIELILAGGHVVASPGAVAVDRQGIVPAVHRVSIRRDDSVLGHLTAYFLVPEVFGSAGKGGANQTERFTGADCADVMTGAIRRAGFDRVWHTSVSGLERYARRIAGPAVLSDGDDGGMLADVSAGDLIRIDYGGALTGHTPRTWDHVAMVWQDRSDPDGPHRGEADGALDRFDLIVHMGHPRLEVEALGEQLPATLDVLRLDDRRTGRQRGPAQRGKLNTTGR